MTARSLVCGFTLATALLIAPVANACVCFASPEPKTRTQITREITTELRKAAAVFSGKVVSQTPLTVTFAVTGVWKGDVTARFEIGSGAVANADGTITIVGCDDFNFEKGKAYVVFAYSTPGQRMHARMCTFTNAMDFAPETAVELDRIARRRVPRR